MLDDDLPMLIEGALGALSADRGDMSPSIRHEGGVILVRVGESVVRMGPGRRGRMLGWERLVDALPSIVENSRLDAMHRAIGAGSRELWSVYATETTRAWLAVVDRLDPDPGRERSILDAAARDADVVMRPGAAAAPARLDGRMRSRRLIPRIGFGRNVVYDGDTSTITARDMLPDTVAVAAVGRDVADIVDLPWMRAADATLAEVRVGTVGTEIALFEGQTPLRPIPAAARRAAPVDGPYHAPWIVTAKEREALDAIDAEAHLRG